MASACTVIAYLWNYFGPFLSHCNDPFFNDLFFWDQGHIKSMLCTPLVNCAPAINVACMLIGGRFLLNLL